MVESTSDSELINAYKNGDISGYNKIVRKYQQQVYWVIRKMVNNHDDADDIKQMLAPKQIATMIMFERKFNDQVRALFRNYLKKEQENN